MKVLIKKLKKSNKIMNFFYFFSIILFIPSFIYFIMGLFKLGDIEKILRIAIIIFFGIWFIIYALCGLLTLFSKKTKTFIFITVLTILFCPIFVASSFVIHKGINILKGVYHENLTYTTALVTLKETDFIPTHTIGMIENDTDIEGHILAKELIEKKNLTNKIEYYEDYTSLIHDLYQGNIGAIFVSNNYAINFESEEYNDIDHDDASFAERVKVIDTLSDVRKNEDIEILKSSKDKKLTEPFTALIMGVDSTKDGLTANQAFNGDTLIMVTFNPNTLTATMFSIPRDMYVPIACNHNRYAKINSSAAYGSSCVIKTIQQLTGIDIDYYVKMNFKGVVDLVNSLDGITVDIEEPDFQRNGKYDCGAHKVCEQNSLRQFGNNLIYIDTGMQTLNGEQALAYARNRHQWAISDIARNQHQQQIIEATAQKLKTVNSTKQFENILNSVSNNIETNMTPEQILSFYEVGKDMLLNSSSSSLSIKKTYLAYYNLPVYLPKVDRTTSALGYYPESLQAIVQLMKVNLELESEQPTKTFSFSYNEDYESKVVGKGLTGGSKLALVKSFIGDGQYNANVWCQNNSISCVFESTTDAAPAGTIINQSAHSGELVKSLNNITFYISNGRGSSTQLGGEEENPNNPNNTGNSSNEQENEENPIPGLPEDPLTPENPEKPSTSTDPVDKPSEPDPEKPTTPTDSDKDKTEKSDPDDIPGLPEKPENNNE